MILLLLVLVLIVLLEGLTMNADDVHDDEAESSSKEERNPNTSAFTAGKTE